MREKFSCRACETVTQPPAPFHVTPRGFAGPNLLAMVLFEKFGQHARNMIFDQGMKRLQDCRAGPHLFSQRRDAEVRKGPGVSPSI